MAKFIAYYRVSTARQYTSGFGLDAQRAAVEDYVDRVGGEIIATFKEVESGGENDRPEIKRALKACRASRAMLVVAKLDRLARNVHFISELLESGVDFVAADMPDANRLTIHVIAAIAEYERQVISDRTKKGLAQAKLAGVVLGNPRLRSQQPTAVRAAQAKADAFAMKMRTVFRFHQSEGASSNTKLANVLNANMIQSARGKQWTATSVKLMKTRIERLDKASDG